MGNLISKHLNSSETPELQSLDTLIPLIEEIHPDKDTNDIKTLVKLLKQEFDLDFSESDIVNHYVISMEQEDAKLTYKHYVGY